MRELSSPPGMPWHYAVLSEPRTDGWPRAIHCCHVLRARVVDRRRDLWRPVRDADALLAAAATGLRQGSRLQEFLHQRRFPRHRPGVISPLSGHGGIDVHGHRARMARRPLRPARPAVLVGDPMDRARCRRRRPRHRSTPVRRDLATPHCSVGVGHCSTGPGRDDARTTVLHAVSRTLGPAPPRHCQADSIGRECPCERDATGVQRPTQRDQWCTLCARLLGDLHV